MKSEEVVTPEDKIRSNSTDEAIGRCEAIIASHRKSASVLFLGLYSVIILFLSIIFYNYYISTRSSVATFAKLGLSDSNPFTQKLNTLPINSVKQYDSLVTKAIIYQKLLNEGSKVRIQNNTYIPSNSISDYFLYGIFILVFGVISSLYRFHLKEINKQEHFLIGFQRIRIAGQNSTTKYDGEVLTALAQDAFSVENVNISKNVKIESPIPGHPTSDIATTILNKILDKVDVVIPEKKGS